MAAISQGYVMSQLFTAAVTQTRLNCAVQNNDVRLEIVHF
jgi:hypothetical protein